MISNHTEDQSILEHTEAVNNIKWIAYSVVAYVIVGVGILGNLASLVVLTRPNLKGVMYVYLLGRESRDLRTITSENKSFCHLSA